MNEGDGLSNRHDKDIQSSTIVNTTNNRYIHAITRKDNNSQTSDLPKQAIGTVPATTPTRATIKKIYSTILRSRTHTLARDDFIYS